MVFFGVLFFTLGCWLVLISGRLSGKAVEAESLLADGGFTRVLKYIFTHNPFTGYRRDIRILLFGVAGLLLMAGGVATAGYFIFTASGQSSR